MSGGTINSDFGSAPLNGVIRMRDHNTANQITGIYGDDAHVAHDAAGNITRIPRFGSGKVIGHYALTYDARNRKGEQINLTPFPSPWHHNRSHAVGSTVAARQTTQRRHDLRGAGAECADTAEHS